MPRPGISGMGFTLLSKGINGGHSVALGMKIQRDLTARGGGGEGDETPLVVSHSPASLTANNGMV
ncbi:hypothetical protein MPRG_23440 [Mycobacterium paragordonae]|uniref:Uncharacterized protein n=1 Tax=Mycobacterium paragordonae TaxID=1389713 RepID=A0ABQ1C527_9MYCO|nr:hypothetical protein MPRG_23440 [Mycobacterium paragordonae]